MHSITIIIVFAPVLIIYSHHHCHHCHHPWEFMANLSINHRRPRHPRDAPPHRRRSPPPWRWRPHRSSRARRSGTIGPGHLALHGRGVWKKGLLMTDDDRHPKQTFLGFWGLLWFVYGVLVRYGSLWFVLVYWPYKTLSSVSFFLLTWNYVETNLADHLEYSDKRYGKFQRYEYSAMCLRNPVNIQTQTSVVKLSTEHCYTQ